MDITGTCKCGFYPNVTTHLVVMVPCNVPVSRVHLSLVEVLCRLAERQTGLSFLHHMAKALFKTVCSETN